MLLPLSVIWTLNFDLLWRYRRTISYISGLAVVIGLPWDVIAAKVQIWSWPANCCSLPRFAGVPLEELLFMVAAALYISSLTLILRARSK